jgi:hypothetical protein
MTEHNTTASKPASEGRCCGDDTSESHGVNSRHAPHRHNRADEGGHEVSRNHGADCCCGHDHNHEEAKTKPVAPQGA